MRRGPGIKTNEVKAERLKAKGLPTDEPNYSAPGIPYSEPEKPPTTARLAPTETKELPTNNSKLQTENMEVHHHPDLHHEKKPWKEYLLEGLMIFLAVFMGFIAESLREHIGDRDREKSYMESLVKDLKLDTAILNRSAILKEQRIFAIDSILKYCRDHRNAKKVPLSTFRQMRRSRFDMFFIHHGGTIDQLKNSGGLRLIRVKGIIDSIELYYQKVQRSESRNTNYFLNQQAADALSEKLLDAYDNIKYYQDFVLTHKALPDSDLMSINTPYLNEYLNNLVGMRVYTNSDRLQFTLDIKNNAGRLIALIKKEYDLE